MNLSPHLQEIVRAFEEADALTPAALAAALRTPVTIDDVGPWIQFDAHNYTRRLVTRGDNWELRLLCWRPGQTTTFHGHGASACAFRILRGSAVESILASRDRTWAPGDVVEESSPDLIHQVGNAARDPLLTLHAYSPPLPVDAPSKREGKNVVIIGGGLSGVAVALHLLRRADPDLRVTIIERGPWLGRGVAYGVDSKVFRLNVPASRMSLDPADPDDFVRWAGVEKTPDAFLPRTLFGSYALARFGETLKKSRGKVRLIRSEVVDVDDRSVHLLDGTRLPAEIVVLATGLAPRLAPSAIADDARVIDAWDECALAALPADGRFLILGSGPTAVDVVAVLQARRFAGTATIVSRRGLLPRSHVEHHGAVAPLDAALVADAPRDLRGLLRWGRALMRETERRGEPWQYGIEALRPYVATLWRNLPPSDRARFVRSVRPYWDVMRHLSPPDAHTLVETWRAEGRLEVLAGSVAACEPKSSGLDVTLRLAGGRVRKTSYDVIVRCIGPALERSETDAPLVRALFRGGFAAADPAGLGIVTDDHGRVVDPAGRASERLFAIGAPRRASSWETTAVPDISQHAAALAKRLLG